MEGQHSKGFTKIELSLVAVLILFLLYFAVTGIRNATYRANDAHRQKDLSLIRTALELYYRDYEHYPQSLAELKDKGYMVMVLQDPVRKTASGEPQDYNYVVATDATPTDYVVWTSLDNKKAKTTLGDISSCDELSKKGSGIVNPDKKHACYRITNE